MRTTLLLLCFATSISAQTWRFAVAGDSRNCGDVVMPAIAAGAKADHAAFYWHLGDFRALYKLDEDMVREAKTPFTILSYQSAAWPDFIRYGAAHARRLCDAVRRLAHAAGNRAAAARGRCKRSCC